ncbi:hypothetical protein [Glutamicibacter sp. X7]
MSALLEYDQCFARAVEFTGSPSFMPSMFYVDGRRMGEGRAMKRALDYLILAEQGLRSW